MTHEAWYIWYVTTKCWQMKHATPPPPPPAPPCLPESMAHVAWLLKHGDWLHTSPQLSKGIQNPKHTMQLIPQSTHTLLLQDSRTKSQGVSVTAFQSVPADERLSPAPSLMAGRLPSMDADMAQAIQLSLAGLCETVCVQSCSRCIAATIERTSCT